MRPTDLGRWILAHLDDDGRTTREMAVAFFGVDATDAELAVARQAMDLLRQARKVEVIGRQRDPVTGRVTHVWGKRRALVVKKWSRTRMDYAHNGETG